MLLEATLPAPDLQVRGASRRWRRASLLVAVMCWSYVVALLLAWSARHWAANRWWPATVLLFTPGWTAIVPLLILIPAAAILRRRLLWLLLAGVSFVAGPTAGLCLGRTAAPPERANGRVIRILTCNVHALAVDVARMRALIALAQPDVVALQDSRSQRQRELFDGGGWHTRRAGGLFLASRYPIGRMEDLELGQLALPSSVAANCDDPHLRGEAACFELELPAGRVRIFNLHLASPHEALGNFFCDPSHAAALLSANSARRCFESLVVQRRAAEAGEEVVLAGDFNTPPDDPIFREGWTGFSDAFAATGFGWGYTYRTRHGSLRIDHILTGSGTRCIRCWTGPPVGSPHLPLIADIRLVGVATDGGVQ